MVRPAVSGNLGCRGLCAPLRVFLQPAPKSPRALAYLDACLVMRHLPLRMESTRARERERPGGACHCAWNLPLMVSAGARRRPYVDAARRRPLISSPCSHVRARALCMSLCAGHRGHVCGLWLSDVEHGPEGGSVAWTGADDGVVKKWHLSSVAPSPCPNSAFLFPLCHKCACELGPRTLPGRSGRGVPRAQRWVGRTPRHATRVT